MNGIFYRYNSILNLWYLLWWLLFIIKPWHQLVFNISRDEISNLLFHQKKKKNFTNWVNWNSQMTYYLYISIFSIFKYNVRLLYSFIRCINYKVHFSTYIEMLLINLVSNQILIPFTSVCIKIRVYFNEIIYFFF